KTKRRIVGAGWQPSGRKGTYWLGDGLAVASRLNATPGQEGLQVTAIEHDASSDSMEGEAALAKPLAQRKGRYAQYGGSALHRNPLGLARGLLSLHALLPPSPRLSTTHVFQWPNKTTSPTRSPSAPRLDRV